MSVPGASEPRPLRDSLTALQRELGLAPPDLLARLRAAWPGLVGDALAAHAEVTSIRDGVCTVTVDDPAFATRVRYLEPAVVAWARGPGAGAPVGSLQVVVARPGATRS